jgi:carbon monoxide dehydrogenase subunit G
MASVHKEILIEALPEHVWAAIRDYGAVRRLVPALVDCRLEGNTRIVTFPDGRVAREILVDINDARRRLVYAEPGGRFITRSASMQVFDHAENGSRLVWINDVLPDEFAEMIARNMDRGLLSIKRTLEGSHDREA